MLYKAVVKTTGERKLSAKEEKQKQSPLWTVVHSAIADWQHVHSMCTMQLLDNINSKNGCFLFLKVMVKSYIDPDPDSMGCSA